MSKGWVKLYRELASHDLWLSEKFTRGQAWADLIMLANHKTGFILVRGIIVAVERGQVGWSESKLASRWKWSRGRVRRFMLMLKDLQMAEQQTSNVVSVITILNYDFYQSDMRCIATASGTTNESAKKQQRDTNKKEKKKKKGRRKDKEGEAPSDSGMSAGLIDEQARVVLEHLNKITGKRFKVTGLIPARLRAGATVEECRQVIDYKAKDVGFDRKYLDHTTLFREANFDKYLNQALANHLPINQGGSNEDDDARGWNPEPENKWAREAG